MTKETKKIELWEGYEVEFDESVANDFDYMIRLDEAQHSMRLKELTECAFGLLKNGDRVLQDARAHSIKNSKYNKVSIEDMQKFIQKICDELPKAGQGA